MKSSTRVFNSTALLGTLLFLWCACDRNDPDPVLHIGDDPTTMERIVSLHQSGRGVVLLEAAVETLSGCEEVGFSGQEMVSTCVACCTEGGPSAGVYCSSPFLTRHQVLRSWADGVVEGASYDTLVRSGIPEATPQFFEIKAATAPLLTSCSEPVAFQVGTLSDGLRMADEETTAEEIAAALDALNLSRAPIETFEWEAFGEPKAIFEPHVCGACAEQEHGNE